MKTVRGGVKNAQVFGGKVGAFQDADYPKNRPNSPQNAYFFINVIKNQERGKQGTQKVGVSTHSSLF